MSFKPYPKNEKRDKKDASDTCQKCEKKGVVNRFHVLCHACNFERLHGKTLAEFEKEKGAENARVKIEKAKSRPLNPLVSRPKLPFFSEKGKEKDQRRKATKAKVFKIALDSNTLFCKGCGVTHGLTNSHILSEALRPDLFDVVENIELLCILCHTSWEHGRIEEKARLKCFVQDVTYIHSVDMPRFDEIIDKMSNYYARTGDEKIGKLMSKLEKLG